MLFSNGTCNTEIHLNVFSSRSEGIQQKEKNTPNPIKVRGVEAVYFIIKTSNFKISKLIVASPNILHFVADFQDLPSDPSAELKVSI